MGDIAKPNFHAGHVISKAQAQAIRDRDATIARLRAALSELLQVQDGLPMTGIEAQQRADRARAELEASK